MNSEDNNREGAAVSTGTVCLGGGRRKASLKTVKNFW